MDHIAPQLDEDLVGTINRTLVSQQRMDIGKLADCH